jgi:hypothetical protein
MSKSGGHIFAPEAYAQGKMLDSSSWHGKLPRGITPSDIDLVFDNNGKCLFCELSRHCTEWPQIECGQRWLYESLVKRGHVAVLLKHSAPLDRPIDTLKDIESFSVMHLDMTGRISFSAIYSGSHWVRFVDKFYKP